MNTQELLRHQVAERLSAPDNEVVAEGAVIAWKQMAKQIIPLVGEDGFNSLYARSVYLLQSEFPWLGASLITKKVGSQFAELKKALARHTPEQAREANERLLNTFTSILASLIGDELTLRILDSAWGRNIPISRQELKNE